MYIYKKGAIGAAVHARIEASKRSVRGHKPSGQTSFLDTLKAQMSVDTSKKPVTAANKADGSTVMYAMKNSNTDTTAASVLNSLGYKQSGSSSNSLKTAADKLSSAAASLKTVLESGTPEAKTLGLSQVIDAYNDLNLRLSASGNTSAYLYRTALNGYTGEEALSGSGVSKTESGSLVLSGEEIDGDRLTPFLNGISTVAGNVSAYSGTITQTETNAYGLDNSGNVSSYYRAMMNMMQ